MRQKLASGCGTRFGEIEHPPGTRPGRRSWLEGEREVPSYRHQLNLGSIDASGGQAHYHCGFGDCTAAGTKAHPP
jgi:hypothetical protein